MTRDEVIQLATQAGLLDKADCSDDYFIPGDAFIAEIEEFARLVDRYNSHTAANRPMHKPLSGVSHDPR